MTYAQTPHPHRLASMAGPRDSDGFIREPGSIPHCGACYDWHFPSEPHSDTLTYRTKLAEDGVSSDDRLATLLAMYGTKRAIREAAFGPAWASKTLRQAVAALHVTGV